MSRKLSKDYANEGSTIISPPEVEALLNALLLEAQGLEGCDVEVAEAVLAVLDRFSDSFAHPSEALSQSVLAWVKQHWLTEPLSYLDVLCSILATLHHTDARAFALQKANRTIGEGHEMLLEVAEAQ